MQDKIIKHNEFSATGVVIGDLWGGGSGIYPAKDQWSDTREQLITMIEEQLQSGELDTGMGFERLTGAVMFITTREYITVDGKTYHREDAPVMEVFGNLTPDQTEAAEEYHNYQ